mgnify:CR=1 FL=1
MLTNFIKSEYVSCQTSDKGKGFLFDHGSGYVYLLNKTGCYIFTLLQEGASIEEIIAKVSKRFNTNSLKISEEIQGFLSEIERMRLVIRHG